jgi:hypothetical protein
MTDRSGSHQTMDRFVLTPEEKRVVVFVLAAFLLGLCTKYYRDTHPAPIPAKAQKNVWQSHRPSPSQTGRK